MTAPGWAQASRRRRSEVRHLARGAGQAAAAAQVRSAGAAKGQPAVRRLQRHAARQGQAPAHVARPDLRAAGPRRRLRRRGARAVRRRLPRRRHRAQFVFLSPDARRLHPGGRRARARLRRHSRRHRQHRAAARRHRASTSRAAISARRTSSRSCSTPRQKTGKDASSIKRGLVSGAALPASLRAELAARGVAVLQCYAIAETRRDLLRERRAARA